MGSMSREMGSFGDTVVAAGSATDSVDVRSASAVPTFAVVSSTDADEEEPLPKRSLSLPALTHDATV